MKLAKNVNVSLLKRVADCSFLFLCKKLAFLFLPFLNLVAQIRCPQNQYTDLKSALDQPLFHQLIAETGEKRLLKRHYVPFSDLTNQEVVIKESINK